MKESVTVIFNEDGDGVVDVSLDYQIESIPPRIVVAALRDLADDEEKSYANWCRKKEMEKDLYDRRN